ncbi:hypothetical protein B0H13DRAFT_1875263 [Mycena leptocephala]|nr:hypothetical protein B0H13DRAFT_1875263 [Mycena leptocephala]
MACFGLGLVFGCDHKLKPGNSACKLKCRLGKPFRRLPAKENKVACADSAHVRRSTNTKEIGGGRGEVGLKGSCHVPQAIRSASLATKELHRIIYFGDALDAACAEWLVPERNGLEQRQKTR